jgi:hypothetical protein
MAKGVVRAGCPLYLANFDVERRVAIPRLLDFANAVPEPACGEHSSRAYALSWMSTALPSGFSARCRSGWQRIRAKEQVIAYSCQSFAARWTPDQDLASNSPGIAVVRLRLRKTQPSPEIFNRPAIGTGTG